MNNTEGLRIVDKITVLEETVKFDSLSASYPVKVIILMLVTLNIFPKFANTSFTVSSHLSNLKHALWYLLYDILCTSIELLTLSPYFCSPRYLFQALFRLNFTVENVSLCGQSTLFFFLPACYFMYNKYHATFNICSLVSLSVIHVNYVSLTRRYDFDGKDFVFEMSSSFHCICHIIA